MLRQTTRHARNRNLLQNLLLLILVALLAACGSSGASGSGSSGTVQPIDLQVLDAGGYLSPFAKGDDYLFFSDRLV